MIEKQAREIVKKHGEKMCECHITGRVGLDYVEAKGYLEAIDKGQWLVKNVMHHHVCEIIETGKEGSCDICRVVGKWYDDK